MTESEIRIACIGDVMCGDSFYALGKGVSSSLDKYGSGFLSPDIVSYLSSHDLVLCNLECVLSDIGRNEHSMRSLHMRGRAEVARYLAGWGIKVANVANNHILEHGHSAAINTVQNLRNEGISVVGAGKNGDFQSGLQETEIHCGDETIALLGVCLRKEKYAYNGGIGLSGITEAIKSLSSKNKIVIVSIHWGDELMDRPSSRQKQIGEELVKAGANMVIGHHPHVVQGIRNIDGNLIAYSLGNFIFNGIVRDTSWSLILSVTFSGQKMIKWSYRAIEKDCDHRPGFVQEKRITEIEQEIRRRCGLLAMTSDTLQYDKQYHSEFKRLEMYSRLSLRKEILRRFPSFKPIYWPQILWRPIQRRTGLW